jgi:hypothetical protein
MKTHNVYLNPERKKYYLQQLDIAKNIKDEVWDLDDGLELILDKINQSSEIQTILSCKPHGSLPEDLSYLHLAYSKKIEKRLRICLLKFASFLVRRQIGLLWINLYNAHEYNSSAIAHRKQLDAMMMSSGWNIGNDATLTLDAVSNPEKYTNINCFVITFNGKDERDCEERNHQIFWRKLCNILSKIH